MPPGSTCTITGWGKVLDNGPLALQIQMAHVPLLSPETCLLWFEILGASK